MEHAAELARGWIGTPYVHQASCKGAGCDCLGLLRGVWRELYGDEPEVPPPYSMDWSEPQHNEELWQAAKRHLIPRSRKVLRPGDVVLFRMRTGSVAKHVGIIGDGGAQPSFIHAYSGHGVVESAFSEPWLNRMVAIFEFPDRG